MSYDYYFHGIVWVAVIVNSYALLYNHELKLSGYRYGLAAEKKRTSFFVDYKAFLSVFFLEAINSAEMSN